MRPRRIPSNQFGLVGQPGLSSEPEYAGSSGYAGFFGYRECSGFAAVAAYSGRSGSISRNTGLIDLMTGRDRSCDSARAFEASGTSETSETCRASGTGLRRGLRLSGWILAFVLGAFCLDTGGLSAEPFQAISESVVQINVESVDFSYRDPWQAPSLQGSGGTGFIIEGNRIMTNAHVVSGAVQIRIKRPSQKKDYQARVAHIAHDCDLAILTVEDPEFFSGARPLEIGSQPALNTPDPSYHGAIWSEAAKPLGPIAYALKARVTLLRDLGGALSPTNAFQFIQGLETLPLRIREHVKNASAVADFLAAHPAVASVNYPRLQTGTAARRAHAYLKGGYGGLVGFELKGGFDAGQAFINALKLFYHVANIGDARSLAIHPASTTHSQLNAVEQRDTGVTEGYVRLSIGIEHIDDIIADLTQALDAAGSTLTEAAE